MVYRVSTRRGIVLIWSPYKLHRNNIDNGSCCSVTQLCLTPCNPTDCSIPHCPVLLHLMELAHAQVHWVGDAIQPSHHLSFPSPPAFNLSQHQGLCQWVGSSHQVAKLLELQHQSFQWMFRTLQLALELPLELAGLISSQSKRLSRLFSNTTTQKHQFFNAQPYLWSRSHIYT